MKKEEMEKLTSQIALPFVKEMNFELVDIEFVKEGPHRYLRIYIDKPGGITIEDCQRLSEKVSHEIDEIDPIEENYFLEVSSPGLDRTLKNDRDLKNNLHKDVEISLYRPIDGNKKYTGELISFDESTVEILEENQGQTIIERKDVAKINLAVKF